jgi:lathosterol oxidase
MRLYGGGFIAAYLQATISYYVASVVLHCVVPALFSVRSVQKGERRPGQILKECLQSLGRWRTALVETATGLLQQESRSTYTSIYRIPCAGPLAVKAYIWTIAENMHARGVSLLYGGPIATYSHVAYVLLCVVALDYLHDTWFYWTHRLLHWKPLYVNIHYMHHRYGSAFCCQRLCTYRAVICES